MSRNLISRYIWIVDTLNKYRYLSREELSRLWLKSSVSDGNPLVARTFYHYRRMIEENFHIDIKCDSQGRYFIDSDEDEKVLTNWLLDSYAVNNAMKNTPGIEERVMVEDVPSAREYLPIVLEAISETRRISFDYAGFSRSRIEEDIEFLPYFVKRYKQRWYMVGLRSRSGKRADVREEIRTYALDRVRAMKILSETFEMPSDISAAEFFRHIIGVTSSKADVRTVKLRTTPTQAKYFRALPFHHTQMEEVHEHYSIFTYRLKLNYELVHEILGFGDTVKVEAPEELKVMVVEQIKGMKKLYDSNPKA